MLIYSVRDSSYGKGFVLYILIKYPASRYDPLCDGMSVEGGFG